MSQRDPSTPPMVPTAAIEAPDSKWPNIIGTLICVFAGLGILQRVFSTVFMAIAPALPLPQGTMPSGSLWTWGLALLIIGIPISFIHLWAGVQTIRRRPSARLWVIVFFVYVLLLVGPNTVFQYQSSMHQMQQMQQMQSSGQQGAPPPGFAAVMQSVTVASTVAGVLFTLAWPTFLLIWYLRPSIRSEMAAWGSR